jgi:hypothetical protein
MLWKYQDKFQTMMTSISPADQLRPNLFLHRIQAIAAPHG